MPGSRILPKNSAGSGAMHELYMKTALSLARRGAGRTSPNPMVGSVLVKRGKIIGKGYHRAVGKPHAEIEALSLAGKRARGSTLYVTLEP
ncbi:MAG: deaminase [Nitrospinota bacterium]